MKTSKIVIGAGLLIAMAAMPTVSAEPTYESHSKATVADRKS